MTAVWLMLLVTAQADPNASLPPRLTMTQALERFHQLGFDLLLAQSSVQSAEADVKIAGAVNNPGLSGSYLHAFGYDANCPGCDADGFGVGLSDSAALLDILSGKRGLRVDVARAALKASQLSRDDARRTLDALLKEQYLAVAIDTITQAFVRQMRDTQARTFALFSLRYGQGDISEADLVRVEVESLQSEQLVDSADAALAQDKVALAFLLGVRGATPAYEVDTTWLQGVVPIGEEALDVPALVQYAVSHRPDLRAQAAWRERAEGSIALGQRLRVPDVELSLGYAQQGTGNSGINPPTLTVGVSLTLPLFYQYQGEILKAQADLRTQDISYSKLTAQVASDIGAAHQALKSSRSRLTRMQERLRGRAARVMELVRLQYDKGAGSLLDLLDAQRTYAAINQDYFANLSDYWTARFELEQAMGLQVAQ